MENPMTYEGKIFCLITGASRGFGRSVATAFAKQCSFKKGSVMVLVGRNDSGLQDTKKLVQDQNDKINVQTEALDLANLESMETFISNVLSIKDGNFDSAILINNAGSLGDTSKKLVAPMTLDFYRKHFDLNVISVILLVQEFFNVFKQNRKLVVNVSSLAAIQEMPYMSLYCTSKAACDMLHKVLACEEKEVRVLNYAPGPMETDMSMEIQLHCGNEASREFFKELRETKKIIDPDVSAAKMVKLLKDDKYKSGDHIDFYDIE